jgi:hypothetical protein
VVRHFPPYKKSPLWWGLVGREKDRKEKRSCRRSHRAMVFSGESLMESPPIPCRMGIDNQWQIKEKTPLKRSVFYDL